MEKPKYPPVFLTVWQDVCTTITAPRQYLQWAFQPVWRSVRFLLFVQAVMAVVVSIVAYNQLTPILDRFATWGTENLPVIRYEDQKITVEQDETLLFSDSDNFFFKLDPLLSLEENPEVDAFYEAGALVVSDGVIFSSSGEVTIVEFSQLPAITAELSPQTVSDHIASVKRMFLIIIPLFVFVIQVISRFLTALLFSFFMVLFSGFKMKMAPVLNLAIYALTPATLISYLAIALFQVTGVFTIIFAVYFVLATTYLRKFIGLTPSNK